MSATQSTELLAAVRQFLRSEVVPELDGFKAYTTRVAANALGIVARELELGAGITELDDAIAGSLGLDTQVAPVPQQISLALRDGGMAVNAELMTYLRHRALLSIAIDNPKYSGLQHAQALWGILPDRVV